MEFVFVDHAELNKPTRAHIYVGPIVICLELGNFNPYIRAHSGKGAAIFKVFSVSEVKRGYWWYLKPQLQGGKWLYGHNGTM